MWFIISLVIIVVLFNIKLPYYVSMPGGTIEINNRISCVKCSSINGSLNLLYVTENEATIPTFLLSFVIPNWDLMKLSEQQVDNETMEDINNRNQLMLEESIDAATMVAYKASNKRIDVLGKKNIVIATIKNNSLKIGDEILEVDNKKMENVVDIREIVSDKNKGDLVKIKVKRDNNERIIETAIKEEDGRKIIGAVIATDYDYKIDPKIELKFRENESGASGGLMIALSIYSRISSEDIIKGRKIAGTGTIDYEGNVGEIDGIKYKIMGAYKNGMDLVFVPTSNYKEAIRIKKKYNYKMKIVKVSKFDDVINYLANM